MDSRTCFFAFVLFLSPVLGRAQQPDTSEVYPERKDSIRTSVVVAHQKENYLSKTRNMKVEVISANGLCKMACCNLAESFENSACVTVGYADAVTGARQIRLLGLSGIYTQILDENRPAMRGINAPFGLTYVPGQWLESIQVSKGVSSVINGVESVTGQINLEYRKPANPEPLYIQASVMNDTKTDLNVASSLQLDDNWSTVILGHADANFKSFDSNGDGFMDDPRQTLVTLSNRWQYSASGGADVRFGISAVRDKRIGGQMENIPSRWSADILNQSADAFLKLGIPVQGTDGQSFAVIADYNYQNMVAEYGKTGFSAKQNSAFVNFLYQNLDNDSHHFTLGASESFDHFNEALGFAGRTSVLNVAGVFGEYTFIHGDDFSLIAGLRGDWFNNAGFRLSPRLTVKWNPVHHLILRANAGRGLRNSSPLLDNIGILSTSKFLHGNLLEHGLEDAWTMGASGTWYFHLFGSDEESYLSIDYFHTRFVEQTVLDYSDTGIDYYRLSSFGGLSYTHNVQVDFSTEPFEGFVVMLTGRYTDARQSLLSEGLVEKPMVSRYKGVLNFRYHTPGEKWIFDFTASVNGPCRVWDFMKKYGYESGYSETYPLLFAQVTRKFKNLDIYLGGENLTDYRQKNPVIGSANPWNGNFDASLVWGPLAGIKIYAGVRFTLRNE